VVVEYIRRRLPRVVILELLIPCGTNGRDRLTSCCLDLLRSYGYSAEVVHVDLRDLGLLCAHRVGAILGCRAGTSLCPIWLCPMLPLTCVARGAPFDGMRLRWAPALGSGTESVRWRRSCRRPLQRADLLRLLGYTDEDFAYLPASLSYDDTAAYPSAALVKLLLSMLPGDLRRRVGAADGYASHCDALCGALRRAWGQHPNTRWRLPVLDLPITEDEWRGARQ